MSLKGGLVGPILPADLCILRYYRFMERPNLALGRTVIAEVSHALSKGTGLIHRFKNFGTPILLSYSDQIR